MTNQKSIAVLPLENLSSDQENEYFADGMTEDIIYALTKVEGLKVTARTSSFAFKGKKEDVRIIGNKLGVATVLEGSIRKAGNRIRISTQLIRTDNGFHLWSENFDRELSDIFSLQDEISLLISERIREEFGHLTIDNHLVKAPTDNVEAYQAYLKARFHLKKWNLQDIEKGANYFEESLRLDPAFDLPNFGAGLCHSLLGSWGGKPKKPSFEKAEYYFQQGSDIRTDSVYAYHCLATHAFWGLWKDQEAIELIHAAIRIDRHNAEINECMAEILLARGEFASAIQFIDRSLENDPLSPNHHYTKANIYYHQHQYQESLQACERSLEIDPAFSLSQHLWLACCIRLKDREGLSRLAYYPQELPSEVPSLLFSLIHGKSQVKKEEVIAWANTIGNQKPRLLMPWDLFLLVQLAPELAMQSLLEKTDQRMGQMVYFKHEIFLEPLRKLAAFKKLEAAYFTEKQTNLLQTTPDSDKKDLLTEAETERYLADLEQKMTQEELYLDTNLTLRSLAEAISLHPNKLSRLLNEKKGKNFNDYINGYRLESFKRKALDNSLSHLTLLGLAYESGFTSKSVFNDYFRKSTGLTPRDWVRQQKG